MKRVFYGKSEKEKDLIVKVLDNYCVPYRITTEQENLLIFSVITYNIEIDVEEKPYEFICGKIKELEALEAAFESDNDEEDEEDEQPDNVFVFSEERDDIDPMLKKEKGFLDTIKELLTKGKSDNVKRKGKVLSFEELPEEIQSFISSVIPAADRTKIKAIKTNLGFDIFMED